MSGTIPESVSATIGTAVGVAIATGAALAGAGVAAFTTWNKLSARSKTRPAAETSKCFGVRIAECPRSGPASIPLVLKTFGDYLQSHLMVKGLFRVPGDRARYVPLRKLLEQDRELQAGLERPEPHLPDDAHLAASLMKTWLRELPPSDKLLHDLDLSLADPSTPDEDISKALCSLPPARRTVVMYVLNLAAQVTKHHKVNQMTKENFAICMAPTLMSDPDLTDPDLMAKLKIERQLLVRLMNWFETHGDSKVNLDRGITESDGEEWEDGAQNTN